MKVREQDKTTSFSYHVDGQLAERSVGSESERFFWDGLALVRRDDTNYLNEPSVTGGNPILADDKVMFNDMLGNTLGIYGKDLQEVKRTSFGSGDETGFFTGKPYVKELGAVFLFRNYRSDLGKWQTSDPLGYPDGWNNFAYCNNGVTNWVDPQGTDIIENKVKDRVQAALQEMLTSLDNTIQQYLSGQTASPYPDYDVSLRAALNLAITNITINYTTKKLWMAEKSYTTSITNQSKTINTDLSGQRSSPDIYTVRDSKNDDQLSIPLPTISTPNPFIGEFTVEVNDGFDVLVYSVNVTSISFGVDFSGSINFNRYHWTKPE